jgi:copper homeostasis protein
MDLEICVDSVESAMAAARGGAERIELCSALSEGGITPSAGLISAVRTAVKIDVFVIIRPRGGDFLYTDHEFEVMRKDILEAKKRGIDGVVLGILTADGTVDCARTRSLVELSRPLQVTFHRAFDVCKDLDLALEEVISCGADRLLTSGGKADARKGIEQIARLRRAAHGRIRIMAGGGIRTSNVKDLALRTGIREVHTSLSKKVKSAAYENSSNWASRPDGCARFLVMENDVRAFKSKLQAIPLVEAHEISVQ